MSTVLLDTSRGNMFHLEYFKSFVEGLGFRVEFLDRVSSDFLAKGRLVVIAGKVFEKYTRNEREVLIRHIKAGHRLFVFVDAESIPYFNSLYEILSDTGIIPTHIRVLSENNGGVLITRNINKSHAITMGIDELVFVDPVKFILSHKKASPIDILVRSEKNHNPPNAVLACSARFGNGKVVAVSSWKILQEEYLGESDNALFVISAMYWLLDMKPPHDLLDKIRQLIG